MESHEDIQFPDCRLCGPFCEHPDKKPVDHFICSVCNKPCMATGDCRWHCPTCDHGNPELPDILCCSCYRHEWNHCKDCVQPKCMSTKHE